MAYPTLAVSTVIAESQAILGDPSGTLYTSAKVIPYVGIAWREFQNRLIAAGRMPSIQRVSPFVTITAGTLEFPDASIPTDFLYPINLREKAVGSSDTPIPMSHKAWNPLRIASDILQNWQWQNERIVFLGATTDRSVQMDYAGSLVVIAADPAVTLPRVDVRQFLSFRAAGLVAEFIAKNKTLAAEMNTNASFALRDLMGSQVMSLQGVSFRKRPYGFRRAMRRRGIL